MTVAELIQELQKYDGDMRVEVQCRDGGGYYDGSEPLEELCVIRGPYNGKEFLIL